MAGSVWLWAVVAAGVGLLVLVVLIVVIRLRRRRVVATAMVLFTVLASIQVVHSRPAAASVKAANGDAGGCRRRSTGA